MQERHDIFVRAHAPFRKRPKWHRRTPKWPRFALIFDTETTVDATQKLTFGCFRRCELVGFEYRCIEEGLVFADALPGKDLRVLERYVKNPLSVPGTERFPPQHKLKLFSRARFISHVFWRAVRNGDFIVGFNLPFDLSRLAIKFTNAKKGGWSLILKNRKSKKTGEIEIDPEKPRVVITSLNSKMAFIKLGSIWNREEWRNPSRFLDLRTLTWALRNESYSLETACKAFGVAGKIKNYKPSGKVTPREIKYCREDVAATTRLLNAAKKEFDQHPIYLDPDEAYSPASISKAYLEVMNIAHPSRQFEISNKMQGIAMQSYFGGRAECRIRKTPVPVVLTDFTSQYPTVNALLGNWRALKAGEVHFAVCTTKVRKLLSTITLEATFEKEFWKQLSFFALVQPDGDILPVRTVYNGRTQNIGLNYLSSKTPIWYAGPDIIAAALLKGKAPRILRAVRMEAVGEQKRLASTNLGGLVPVDPRVDDFFVRVVEQRSRFKRENKALARFLKVLGNSGSYGLFVQIDPETRSKPKSVRYYSGEKSGRVKSPYVEKPGPWYFPPLASLITSGGRLLLAMLERCVQDVRGSYLFCDTDSMCIVASAKGGLAHCAGGRFKPHGRDAVRALSFDQVKSIADRFNGLNPYDPSLVGSILKIEDVNYVDLDPRKPLRQVFGYAIAAKRYALYTQTNNSISVVKASGHGLGYLFTPKRTQTDDEDEYGDSGEAPAWVIEAWSWLLHKELGFRSKDPTWLSLPAMMRMAMTSPNVMRHSRPDWLAPFNFFLFPLISDLGGYPAGLDRATFNFIVPFESDRRKWKSLEGINLRGGQICRISMTPDGRRNTVVPESLGIILRQYLRHREAKSLAPDGSACVGDTRGLLRRASIVAGEIVPIGKETDRHWEQGEDPSLIDFEVKEYRKRKKMAVADIADRKSWRQTGVRYCARKSGLSINTVRDILDGKPVKVSTLAAFMRTMNN